MSLSDRLEKSNAKPVYLLTVTAGDTLTGFTALAVPDAPVVSSSVDGDVITLTWSAVETATKYTIYRSTTQGGPYSEVDTTTETSYDDTGLSEDEYYYVVTASNLAGESDESEEVTETVGIDAPENLTATAADYDQIDLSWDSVDGATSYHVYRSETSGGPYTEVDTTASASYSDTGLTQDTTYYYVVTADDGTNESSQSSEASATTIRAILDFHESAADGALTTTETGEDWYHDESGTGLDSLERKNDALHHGGATGDQRRHGILSDGLSQQRDVTYDWQITPDSGQTATLLLGALCDKMWLDSASGDGRGRMIAIRAINRDPDWQYRIEDYDGSTRVDIADTGNIGTSPVGTHRIEIRDNDADAAKKDVTFFIDDVEIASATTDQQYGSEEDILVSSWIAGDVLDKLVIKETS